MITHLARLLKFLSNFFLEVINKRRVSMNKISSDNSRILVDQNLMTRTVSINHEYAGRLQIKNFAQFISSGYPLLASFFIK